MSELLKAQIRRMRVPMAGLLLVALLSAAALGAAPQPKALVLAWDDGGATAKVLRDAGFDTVVPPRQTVGGVDLGDARLVVLSADMPLPDELAGRVAALVRGGGALLVVHTSKDPNFWWTAYRRVNRKQPNPSPLWDVLPFTQVPIMDQEVRGIRNPFGPTRVLRQADSPLLKGVDLTQAPAFPLHGFMVLPTHPIVQGTHLMFGWSEDQYKSPLWGNGQVLAWGDDPEQRPLLLTAEYGAGRCAAAAVPLFDPAFLKWPGSRTLIGNLARWLLSANGGKTVIAAGAEEPAVYGVGVPWIVQDSLRRMGWRVTDQAAGAAGAVVYGVPTAGQAQAVALLAKGGKPVVVANPEALEVAPLSALVSVAPAAAPSAVGPATAPPTPTVDARPLQNQNKILRDQVWANDPDNVGKAQGWFTPEGAARVKWVADLAEPNQPALSKPQDAPDAPDVKISWSKTYRWRLEGNLLDRRDFVEGWDRPDYNDSAWAEQPFGQNPPSPKLLGQQTPAQNLLAGAVWARARLTLVNPQASRQWLMPSEDMKFVTLLDGKPLRQKVEVRTLAAGEHVVALRAWPLQAMAGAANYDPWGRALGKGLQWPSIAAEAVIGEAGPSPSRRIWYKANVRLPADSRWNAIQIDQPSAAVLYVNGKRISGGASDLVCVPWRAGDNLVVWGNLNSPKIPSTRLAEVPMQPAAVTVPAAQRLSGVWYSRDDPAHESLAQGWPAALAGEAPPAGWTPITPDPEQGTVAGVPAERPDWFAAPFLVSESEAHGPARLVIDTTGGAVPTDLIKTIWVNGQPVPARIEFVSTQRYDLEGGEQTKSAKPTTSAKKTTSAKPTKSGKRTKSGKPATGDAPAASEAPATGDEPPTIDEPTIRGKDRTAAKQTTISFVVSGRLKPGLNWLAFPADLQNVYGLRMAVPAGLGWTVPLPKLDFSGRLDAVAWAQPLSRLDGAGLVRRGQLVTPPAGATVLARFSDGVPAVARVGSVTFATSDQSRDWSPWIEEAVRIDWAATKQSLRTPEILNPFNLHNMNHASGDPVQADGTQVAASLLRGTPEILGATPAADGGAVVRLAPATAPRLLSYQLRNWMGMVLAEGRLAVPAQAERVVVPAPAGDPSPLTTRLRADRWLRAALLQSGGASVCDYLETRVDARPLVEVLLSPTDGLQRDLPATIPGAPNYDPRNLDWSVASESPASPVVVPGERIRLRAMCRNTTTQPQQVALDLAWEGALESKPVALRALRFTLAPYEQRTEVLPCGFQVVDMRFTALPDNDASPLRALPTGRQPVGALTTGRVVARAGDAVVSELPLIAVRPWKQFAPYSERPSGQQGSPAGFEMSQFFRTPSLESLAAPPHYWWTGAQGGHFYSATDWWRDHFVDTSGNGGGFDGFKGEKDFAWGPYDDVYLQGLALDNAGYLPDGTQYQEFLYASINREYNRFMRGTQPLIMQVADYWACGATSQRERNLVHFLRWRSAQGRPLHVSTASEVRQLIQEDPAVHEDWRVFVRDAYLGWCQQFMAGLPPHSVNNSQGESNNYRFGRLHDDLAAFRTVLETHNSGILQPANLSRRGELDFGAFRAINPACLVADLTWHGSVGHSQTSGGAWGSNGSVFSTPEFAGMMYLDYGLMAIRDDQGRIQPTINTPPWFFGVRPIPLFTIDRNGGFCLPADALARDVTSHLNHLIQPERVLGSYVMPSLERAAKDKVDGTTIDFGTFVSEAQPEVVLTHVLRNYGALWGGTIAPDRVNRLQPGEGALYIMPSGVGDAEAKPMADFVRNGGHVSVFFSAGGTKTQETALSTLFGVKYAPVDKDVQGTMRLGPNLPEQPYLAAVYGQPQYVSTGQSRATDFVEAKGALTGRVLLRGVEAGEGRAVFSPLNANLNWGWDHDLARRLAQAVNWAAGNPVTLPDGVGGCAFEAKDMTFLVLQDLKYTGGEVSVHVKMPKGKYVAADVFSGTSVSITQVEDGLNLHVVLPPNGSSLVVLRKESE
jgi:hypothetical protein